MSRDKNLVCVGKILSAHGIRGAVKIQSFTEDPRSILQYSPLTNANGSQEFTIKAKSDKDSGAEVIICYVNNIKDRNEVEKLRGIKLYINRDKLPEIKDEDQFYYSDLVGLDVISHNSRDKIGKVKQVMNYGAGDMVEIDFSVKRESKIDLFAFTKENFPEIKIKDSYVSFCEPDIEYVPTEDEE